MTSYTAFIMFFSTQSLHAGIKDDMMGAFTRLGMNTNTTGAGSFKDQSAGYYNGGSLIGRVQPRNTQLATVQLPSYRAGCGGIDAYVGGFSHISSEELVKAIRGIGSAMGSYAFMLAIQTMSPQIYNVLNELNALATKINNMNINSCETAATMVGAVWPKSDMASQHLCKSMGSSLGDFSDYSKARHNCGAGGKRDQVLSGKDSNESYKRVLVGEYNIAWKAMQDYDFLKKDPKLAEVFMTLSGTLISRKKNDTFELISLSSRSDNSDLLHALLDGGTAITYSCGNDLEKCLNPVSTNTTLEATSGFRTKVQQMLEEMVGKIYDDIALSKEEKSFLNSTRLPVYKILNVLTAFKKGSSVIDIQDYADIIALDIIYRYMMEVMDLINDNINQLKSSQVDDTQIKRFQQGLASARSRIVEKRTSVFQHLQAVLSLVEKTRNIERHMHATFTLNEGL